MKDYSHKNSWTQLFRNVAGLFNNFDISGLWQNRYTSIACLKVNKQQQQHDNDNDNDNNGLILVLGSRYPPAKEWMMIWCDLTAGEANKIDLSGLPDIHNLSLTSTHTWVDSLVPLNVEESMLLACYLVNTWYSV